MQTLASAVRIKGRKMLCALLAVGTTARSSVVMGATTLPTYREHLNCVRAAKYTVDGGARGMREVFRSASWPPRLWA